MKTAYEQISEIVTTAAEANPELGLSFGYIGNLEERWNLDDRSWRVFTKVRHVRSFGDYATVNLHEMLKAIQSPYFAGWLERAKVRATK